MSQVYLYSTYQRYQNLADTKKKIIAILNQQKKKVDTKAAAEWISEKIQNKEINIIPRKVERVLSVQTKINREKKQYEKLPSLIGTSSQKLQD